MNDNVVEIDIPELQHSLDHLRLDHPVVVKAFEVAARLRGMLDQHAEILGLDEIPTPSVAVWHGGVLLDIGDTTVWYSENDNDEELTVDKCWATYRLAALQMGSMFSPECLELHDQQVLAEEQAITAGIEEDKRRRERAADDPLE